MMSKRDHELIASAIRHEREVNYHAFAKNKPHLHELIQQTLTDVSRELAWKLYEMNHRFDVQWFITACEIPNIDQLAKEGNL